jgi:hypothetical protein
MNPWRWFRRSQPPPASVTVAPAPPAKPPPVVWRDLLTAPTMPRAGTFRGVLSVRKERTSAGCVMTTAEKANLPEILLLAIGEQQAPLKWLEPGREDQLARAATDDAFPIAADPLLTATDAQRLGGAIGGQVELHGVAYPMYATGTIVAIVVWGLYVRPLSPA